MHDVPEVAAGVKLDQAAAVAVAAEAQVTLMEAFLAVPAGMQTLRVEAVAGVADCSQALQHPEEAQSVEAVQIPAAAVVILVISLI